MYEKFYGFKERPFNVTPDARFFYPSRSHKAALDSLYYAVTERRGFAVLTGSIGVGKTTVWRALIKNLDSNTTKVGIITNTHLTPKQLLESLLEEIDIDVKTLSKNRMLSLLDHYLIDQFAENNTVVLIVDEAQNLPSVVLEELRMLSNLETEEEKLLQIILVGQPEFREKLRSENLAQLRQRITVAVHIDPLSREETEEYIRYRLGKVSLDGKINIFTPDAFDKIYEISGGVPRLINSICDGALLVGYANGTYSIDGKTVKEAIDEFLSFTCFTTK